MAISMFDQIFPVPLPMRHVEPIVLVGSMTSRDGLVRDAGTARLDCGAHHTAR